MGRDINVKAYEDTIEICRKNHKLEKSIKNSIASQKIIKESDKINVPSHDNSGLRARVIVSDLRTLEAFNAFNPSKYSHVAVLNSTWDHPGGRVSEGENGLQESLCRCTTLKPCLDACESGFYSSEGRMESPFFNDDVIFTPGVTIIKEDGYSCKTMPESEWCDIDVISCTPPDASSLMSTAKYDKPINKKDCTEEHFIRVLEERFRRILDVTLSNGCDSIILGAFGCGRAKVPAGVAAQAAANVIKDYLYAFRNIIFAIHDEFDNLTFETFQKTIYGTLSNVNIPDLEKIKNYILYDHLIELEGAYEYAVNEPQITKFAVYGIADYCLNVIVWIKDPTEENCTRIGSKIYKYGVFPYIIGDPTISDGNASYANTGLVIYDSLKASPGKEL